MRVLKLLSAVLLVVCNLHVFAQDPELILPASHSNQLEALTVSRNEKYIASADLDGKVKIWENETGKLLKTLVRASIYSLAFTPDNKKLVIASFTVPEVYTIETGESIHLGKQQYCEGLDISPDGKWIAIGAESKITIWDAKTFQLRDSIKSSHINSEIVFSPDSKTLLLFGGQTPEIWSLEKRSFTNVLKGHSERVINFRF
jgi:WD40 repeat protein